MSAGTDMSATELYSLAVRKTDTIPEAVRDRLETVAQEIGEGMEAGSDQ
jgi:hypothetical protein